MTQRIDEHNEILDIAHQVQLNIVELDRQKALIAKLNQDIEEKKTQIEELEAANEDST